MGVGVHIMQTNPDAQFTQCLTELLHMGFDRLALPEPGAKFYVHPVGTGILRNHQ